MPGPGKAFEAGRQQGVDLERFVDAPLDQPPLSGVQQYVERMGLVAQGGGQAPDDQFRYPAAQPRQRQLQLHATLVAQQLVPLVHHQHAQAAEGLAGIGAGQQQCQAFWRGDQRAGQASALACAFGTAGIAGAQADAPGDAEIVQWRLQGSRGIGGQGAHGGDPEDAEWGGFVRWFDRCLWLLRGQARSYGGETIERAEPDGIGLARAGGGVEQTGFAVLHGLPDVPLERKGLPATVGEPGFAEILGRFPHPRLRRERGEVVRQPRGPSRRRFASAPSPSGRGLG